MKSRPSFAIGLSLCLVILGSTCWSAEPSAADQQVGDTGDVGNQSQPSYWGTTIGIDHWIPASSFTSRTATSQWSNDGLHQYSATSSGGGQWEAHLQIENGAYVDGFRVYYCDTDSSNALTVAMLNNFYQEDGFGDGTSTVSTVATFSSPTSGSGYCSSSYVTVQTTLYGRQLASVGDGYGNFYTFTVSFPAATTYLKFKGVRVYWYRQVSPPPATASFEDVPTTSPYFAYVEAVTAAGIMGGTDHFYPDDPVDRGHLAAYLSKALGLAWGH